MLRNLILALTLLCSVSAVATEEKREFLAGYIGTLPSAKEDRAKTYFSRPEVRRLLAALERGPLPESGAAQILTGSATRLSDLTRLRLVNVSGRTVRIGFPYFTARDVRKIHAVAAKYVPGLVAAIAARRTELYAILSSYPVATVPRTRLAFVVLAGFSLNWDALDLLKQHHWREPLLISGAGWQYGFWASEDVPDYSYKGYYWGSSTFPAGSENLDPPLDFAFSSFGDPQSDPRVNFPDLFLLPPDQMTPQVRAAAEALGLRNEEALGTPFDKVIGLSRARAVGAMLFAMREGTTEDVRICSVADIKEPSQCRGLLRLLSATGYAKLENPHFWRLLVPVFDVNDAPLLANAMTLNRTIVASWLARSYEPIRHELSSLTAVREGVPYPALFSQIWHELFGLATRELVAEGLVEDPYGAGAPWKGSVPALWRTKLDLLRLQ